MKKFAAIAAIATLMSGGLSTEADAQVEPAVAGLTGVQVGIAAGATVVGIAVINEISSGTGTE